MKNLEIKDKCSKRVSIPGRWFGTKQCENKAKVNREGKFYCTIHDPLRIKQKSEVKEKLWEAQQQRQEKEFKRRQLEIEYCKALTNEQLKQGIKNINPPT